MEPFFGFLLAVATAGIVSVISFLFARKAGLGPVQREYRSALEGTNSMLSKRLALLEKEGAKDRALIGRLSRRIARLERTVLALAEENGQLRAAAGMPPRAMDPEAILDDTEDAL